LRFSDGSALQRHHFIRLGFIEGWKAIAAVGPVEQTFERLEIELNAVAQTRGELSLAIPMACFVAHKQVAGASGSNPAGAEDVPLR
jgi:arsenite methyltransferase